MKIYELSKELEMENKELIDMVNELGIEVKSHMNNLDDEQVELVKKHLNIPKKTVDKVQKPIKKLVKPKVEPKKWVADLDRMICVENVSPGKLIYISKRQMGYKVVWDKPGDTNYLELSELVNLKNSNTRFIREPWIRIAEDDEYEILQYLNVLKYYQGVLGLDNLPAILVLTEKHTFEDFKARFDRLPKSYKDLVVKLAADMLKNGTLDSIKIKNYIEKEQSIDLDILTSDKTK